MKSYDHLKPPDPQQWLALGERARMALVQDYHRRKRIRLPNEQVHAIAHAVVESQIALGDEVPVRTLQRLMGEGLDRHQAIHAIGLVLMEHIVDLINAKSPAPGGDPNPAYFAAIERLTAEEWRRLG